MNFAFPDVCKTVVGPAIVPLPYPNISTTTTAIPNIFNIFVMCMPVHNMLTMVPLSNGDEAGVTLGVVSQLIIGPTYHILGSFKVFKQVMPVTKWLSPTGQNGIVPNMVGTTLTPCQPKVMILT